MTQPVCFKKVSAAFAGLQGHIISNTNEHKHILEKTINKTGIACPSAIKEEITV